MSDDLVRVRFAEGLRFLLAARVRGEVVEFGHDPTATLGHLVRSAGVPLTEVGRMAVDGLAVNVHYRPGPGETVDVEAVEPPQRLPFSPPRFLLDVHLGALARRMRLIGIDTAYDNDAEDAALVEWANAEQRALLTRDRGLLHRRALLAGALIREDTPDDQLREVLDRFDPPTAPWTRCPSCNGPLRDVDKSEVAAELEPGTRRTYDTFARCEACGRVFWPGAHHRRLNSIVSMVGGETGHAGGRGPE
ncbi:Mut7-C RNAse domain-containing protein [Nocardiopsis suaedae]|uniref:Twitching motility protein PilT n=1 Tax=Nocardiopsis suaedae TaxID=3018444 RepID=A0ABT4TRG5_9ACTN|nr:Mut7-C RNAse domain-containing protein [Nocardiopsis suaedae]MDA2807262.1 hypothetical protein [Nocardiopsis suaedae]